MQDLKEKLQALKQCEEKAKAACEELGAPSQAVLLCIIQAGQATHHGIVADAYRKDAINLGSKLDDLTDRLYLDRYLSVLRIELGEKGL